MNPIQTGKVLRLAFEGKSDSDSDSIVILEGISSSAKDIKSRKRISSTPVGKVRFSNSLDTGFRSLEKEGRLRKKLATITIYPALLPGPEIIPVPRPLLH